MKAIEKTAMFDLMTIAIPALGVVLLLYRDMTTDDTFIFLQFARNIIERGEISFNVGHSTYGFTSPLWLFGVVASSLLSPDLLSNVKYMSLVFYFLSIVVFHAIAKDFFEDRNTVTFSTLVWAINPVLMTMALSGMESTLAVTLTLAFYYFFRRELKFGILKVSPFFLSLGILARPEIILLGLLAVPFVLNKWYKEKFSVVKESLPGLVLAAVPLVIWMVKAYETFGTIVPNPVVVKSVESVNQWQLEYVLKRFFMIAGSMNGMEFLLGGITIWCFIRKRNDSYRINESGEMVFLITWIIALNLVYLLRKVVVSPRYLLLASPFITLCVMKILDIKLKISKEFKKYLYVGVGIICLASGVMTWKVYYPHVISYNKKDLILKEFGLWLNKNTREGEGVASIDIGLLGYFSRRPIFDLTGLINLDIVSDTRNAYAYLADRNVRYYLDRHPIPGVLQGDRKIRSTVMFFKPVLYKSTESIGWIGGLVENQRIGFTLYEISPK